MHYKNGREAALGDKVIHKDSLGQVNMGIVVSANAGSTTCNLGLVPATPPSMWATASECVRADDAHDAVCPMPTSCPELK